LKAAKPDKLPPPAIPIAYQSKPIPQEPRTELDIEPEKPWYKRPITGPHKFAITVEDFGGGRGPMRPCQVPTRDRPWTIR
jgi:hypothetical protein